MTQAHIRKQLIHFYKTFVQKHSHAPLVGLCGAQGCGKTTLAKQIASDLKQHNINCLIISLDDFYLTQNERLSLSQHIHPLFKTRGVPGTHDISLLMQTLDKLQTATAHTKTYIPQFDKARDDRMQKKNDLVFTGKPDLIIIEGWCIGAKPQPENDLKININELEKKQDAALVWRTYVNDQLKTSYQFLFERINYLMLLKIPDWDIVFQHRLEQEQELKEKQRMSAQELKKFIMHFERLTRWMLQEMPARAQLTIDTDEDRKIIHIHMLDHDETL